MNFIKSRIPYVRAGLAYVKTLFGRIDKVDSVCSRGHTLLKNWSNCPECKVVNRLEELQRRRRLLQSQAPKLALYCISGANKGQSFVISKERSSLGCEAEADFVLTPESLNTRGSYQVLVNGKVQLTSSDTNYFKLNGQSQQSATLLDFDELELLDNRFLVLDLRNRNGVNHDH